MSIKSLLLAAGLAVVTAAPAFAATHNIRADRAALAAARADLHKFVVTRAHDRHALYVALHQHKPKLAAQARHRIAMDNAAIHRDVLAIHRARLDLHRDYVAMHHPVMHPAAHS
ncbi:MAG: hypothetical protein M0Z76_07740 [Gammaproteobacteria bacterium]|nr:hypothetical protein [Gammaproteobacteria bacterium]